MSYHVAEVSPEKPVILIERVLLEDAFDNSPRWCILQKLLNVGMVRFCTTSNHEEVQEQGTQPCLDEGNFFIHLLFSGCENGTGFS
jgi:hypothetical protein